MSINLIKALFETDSLSPGDLPTRQAKRECFLGDFARTDLP